MASCGRCNGKFAESDLDMTAEGPVCPACGSADEPEPTLLWSTPAIALFFAIVPFFLQLSFTTTRMINGGVVESMSRDYLAVGCGGLALIIGAFGCISAFKSPDARRTPGLVLCCAAVTLGAYQIARGLGMF